MLGVEYTKYFGAEKFRRQSIFLFIQKVTGAIKILALHFLTGWCDSLQNITSLYAGGMNDLYGTDTRRRPDAIKHKAHMQFCSRSERFSMDSMSAQFTRLSARCLPGGRAVTAARVLNLQTSDFISEMPPALAYNKMNIINQTFLLSAEITCYVVVVPLVNCCSYVTFSPCRSQGNGPGRWNFFRLLCKCRLRSCILCCFCGLTLLFRCAGVWTICSGIKSTNGLEGRWHLGPFLDLFTGDAINAR